MSARTHRQPSTNATLRVGYYDPRGIFVDQTPAGAEKDFARCCEHAAWLVNGTLWTAFACVQERAFDGRHWRTLHTVQD